MIDAREAHGRVSTATGPDFQRPVHAVLGLPFDAVSEAEADAILRSAIAERRRCFMSTPNLNFAMACRGDAQFRQSVLQSDLSVADGWPVTLVARLTGAPVRHRVAGSSLFDRLCASSVRPALRAFFFGGPPGAAEAAQAKLNESDQGVRCVGVDPAGFGDIESMSTLPVLDRINASRADFLVVSIGAKRGQAWIQRNLAYLEAPVISYLGAVVNFVAGTVARAPHWMQRIGCEWLWRIIQERSLVTRYSRDGSALLRVLFSDVLALSVWLRRHAPTAVDMTSSRLDVEHGEAATTLKLGGAWSSANVHTLRSALRAAVDMGHPVRVDLGGTSYLDASVVGLLMLLHGWHGTRQITQTVVAASPQARRVLRHLHAEYLTGA